MRLFLRINVYLLISLIVASCTSGGDLSNRRTLARDVAAVANLEPGEMDGGLFRFMSWQHIEQPGSAANIYIEGDGLAWKSRSRPSLNPTPRNPVGLRLAAKDPATNVIYLARPCQYIRGKRAGPCDFPYWTDKRFAPEIIDDYMGIIDSLKAQYDIREIHLVGFSGGANIAALLAARRTDVKSLRTVAGNLDHEALNRLHGVSLMPGSLNAAREAFKLKDLAQIHFIGGKDKIVTKDIHKSYARAMGASICNRAYIIPGASHTTGWEASWPALLKQEFSC
ncbi:MAG: hypothetical protein V7750_06130 [Sneathiella sp.]